MSFNFSFPIEKRPKIKRNRHKMLKNLPGHEKREWLIEHNLWDLKANKKRRKGQFDDEYDN